MLIDVQEYKKVQMGEPCLSQRGTELEFDLRIGEEVGEQSRRVKTVSSWKEKGAAQSRPKPLLGRVQSQVDMEGSEMNMSWLV